MIGLVPGGDAPTSPLVRSPASPATLHHTNVHSPPLCPPQLCAEDYHWWWRAYFTSGASALYLLAYSAFYFYSKLTITKTIPMLMYFGYMSIVSYGFFCLTGQHWGQDTCMWALR